MSGGSTSAGASSGGSSANGAASGGTGSAVAGQWGAGGATLGGSSSGGAGPGGGKSGSASGGTMNANGGSGPPPTSGGSAGQITQSGGAGGSAGSVAAAGGTSAPSAVGAPTSPVTAAGWKCPQAMSGTPTLANATPTRVAGVPPADGFSDSPGSAGAPGTGPGMGGGIGGGIGGGFGGFGGIGLFSGNLEGPVWIGDALYLSELSPSTYDETNTRVAKSRILKVGGDGSVSVFIADSGSNGLAVDGAGAIIAAVHKDGTLTRFPLPSGAPTYVATGYMGLRFDAPNDLVMRSDGNIYFSDPEYQAPTPAPQAATRMYRVSPAGEVSAFPDDFMTPNGVTLSVDESWLYVAAQRGRRYPLAADGSVGAGEDFAPTSGVDGITMDCAGNIYVARNRDVAVYDSAGNSVGRISVPDVQSVTNMAFGGADRKTLYITGQGPNRGLFKVTLDIPGRPY